MCGLERYADAINGPWARSGALERPTRGRTSSYLPRPQPTPQRITTGRSGSLSFGGEATDEGAWGSSNNKCRSLHPGEWPACDLVVIWDIARETTLVVSQFPMQSDF